MGDGRLTVTGRRRLQPEVRRQQLLDAAATLVTDEGIAAVTMDSVAAKAHVSRSLLYLHFDNRRDLLNALFDREFGRFDVANGAILVSGLEPADKLRAIVEAAFDRFQERGVLMRAITQLGSADPELSTRIDARWRAVNAFLGQILTTEFGVPAHLAVATALIVQHAFDGLIDAPKMTSCNKEELVDAFVIYCLGGFHALHALSESAPQHGRAVTR